MLRGYRNARNDDKAFQATGVPGVRPFNFNMDVDIDDIHYSFGHVYDRLLRETAEQRNVNFTDKLRECRGRCIAKERAKPVFTTTGTRAGVGREVQKPRSFDPRKWSLFKVEFDASGKDQANQSTSRLAALRAKIRAKNLMSFLSAPRRAPTASPKGRITQSPSLTPATTSERRAASLASLTTAGVSGRRVTPATVASINERSRPAEFEGSEV